MDSNSTMLIDNNGSFEMDNQHHMDVDASHNQLSMTLLTPARRNEDGPNAETDDGMVPDPGTQPSKRRRKKSMVWEHFTIETASPGSTKACCKHCRKSFAYITGQKLAGTSHLKRHIQLGICPMSRETNLLTQTSETKDRSTCPPKKRQRSSATYTNAPLDQDHCYHEMAKMIIMHEYPLHMVEHSGFTGFVQALRPQFSMASFNTIHNDCVTMYLSEKQKLLSFISEIPGRVNLTIDLWTSNQSVGYAFVTGHFIDKDWNLTHRLLNVAVLPSPDSNFALNQPLAACLSDWNLERKLSSLTVGPSVVNKTAIENLRCFLSVRNQQILNGQLLLGNCYARLLSSMAQDVLGTEELEVPIKKVRDSVKYVKTNDTCGERFDELKRQLQIPSTKDLLIDNQTKWDTSYNMLLSACEHKEVFSCMENCDPDYRISTSPEEWRKIEVLCLCLKVLFDAANVLTGPSRLTANDLYHEMTKFQLELSHAAMSEDPDVRNLANPLREKFDEYWRGCFLLLAVAVVMDPRFKMKLIEFSFSKTYGEDADKWISTVDEAVHDLYMDYAEQNHPLLEAYVGHENDGFSETDMAQVHFHHVNHLSNGISHDQMYEQHEDGNSLNGQSRDHVLDESQEIGQDDQSSELRLRENQHMDRLCIEGQRPETASLGGHLTDGVEQESHSVDAGAQEGLTEESHPIEGLTQERQVPEDNLGANGEPTLAQESQLIDNTAHESQIMEEAPHEIQSAEEMPHQMQLVENFHRESQPSEDIALQNQQVEDTTPPERYPDEEMLLENQKMEDKHVTQDTQSMEEMKQETQSVEEVNVNTLPVGEKLEQANTPVELIPPESHYVEETPLANQQVDDKHMTQSNQEDEGMMQEKQPTEEMLEGTRPDDEMVQEAQLVEEIPDDTQSVEEGMVQETQPTEQMPEDSLPVDEVIHETQLVDDMAEDTKFEEVGQETQTLDDMPEETQPVEEVAQENMPGEAQPVEEMVQDIGHEDTQPFDEVQEESEVTEVLTVHAKPAENTTRDPQNGGGLLPEEQHPRQCDAMPQDQQLAEQSHPHQDDEPHAMPQEENTFTISQEGHHVDVLLQEGHHLEASQDFPLITIGDGFSDFELYISEIGSQQQMKSELDQYLEESLIPRSQDFEVLGWWSLNRSKYPTLSKMAADVLSVPFCTVSPDSVFDTEVKKMDSYRSSLRHVTLEALFCAKDWLKHASSTSINNVKREES